MARWHGKVGFATFEVTRPGVHTEVIVEREYYGDKYSVRSRLQGSGNLNDNVITSSDVSIVADTYAINHFADIRYVIANGSKWKAMSVNADSRPRIIISLGELYNG